MIISLLPMTVLAAEDVWDGTTVDTDWYDLNSTEFTLSTAAELAGFSAINNGTAEGIAADTFSGKTVKLGADIDLNWQEWTPIVNFSGTFDGQNFTVSNLKITVYAAQMGLFGSAQNAELKNALIAGIDISHTSTSNPNIGGLLGQGSFVKVINCGVSNGSIRGNAYNAGGLIGSTYADNANKCYVEYCFNYNVVVDTTGNYKGSLIGQNNSQAKLSSSYAYVSAQKDAPLSIAGRQNYASNCVSLATTTNTKNDRWQTEEQFASGVVTGYLNEYTGGSLKWGQELGVDAVPSIGGMPMERIQIAPDNTYAYVNAELTTDTDGTYIIRNAAEWVAFANLVNDNTTESLALSAKVAPNAIIDFSTIPGWEDGIPASGARYLRIGFRTASQYPYTGNFDGNECTVKGLNFSEILSGTNDPFALFGNVNAGTIKNITIEDISINTSRNAAGFVLFLTGGTLENCHITSGSITGTSTSNAVSGLVVQSKNATIKNCSNGADVTSAVSSGTGGILAYVLTNYTVTIENCVNTGNITSTSNTVGGIAGKLLSNCAVIECYNTGTITAPGIVGGLVGSFTVTSGNSGEITNSYNLGTVNGGETAYTIGGILGDGTPTLMNCYNVGTVTGKTCAQPLIGKPRSDTAFSANKVINTYSLQDCVDTDLSATQIYYGSDGTNRLTVGKTDDDFSDGAIAYLLHNGTDGSVWGQTLVGDDKDAYPVLNGEEVIKITFESLDGDTAPNPAYTNVGEILETYPVPAESNKKYTFYSDASDSAEIAQDNHTYSADTTVYVKTVSVVGAAVSGSITGYTDISLTATLSVTLTNATFTDDLDGNWITNLPGGLTQSVTRENDTEVTITISGTPIAAGDDTLTVTVPANATDAGEALTCSGTVTYDIQTATYTMALEDTQGGFEALEYGYTAGNAVTYTIRNTGNQALEGIAASITDGDNAFEITTPPDDTVKVGEVVTVIVTSKTGLGVSGSPYTGTLTLTWDNDSTGLTQNLSQTVNVATGSVTITGDISKTYDGNAVSEPTYNNVGDGAVTVEYKVKDADDNTYTVTAPADAGDYTVRVSVAASSNYAAASATADFTISAKEIEIVWTEDNFTYNGTDQKNSVTAYYLDVNSQQIALAVTAPAEFKDYTAEGYVFSVSFANGETNYVLPSDVTKTYHIKQAAQSKPEGVAGVDTSFIDLNDGEITGVTDKMEYKLSTADRYTAISSTVVENLAAGTYYVRYAADANHTASEYVEVTINKGGLHDAALAFATGLDLNKTYDGNAVVFENGYTYNGDGVVSVKWYADDNDSKGNELSSAPVEAGTYHVGISASEGDIYNAVSDITMAFTIAKKNITGATITLGTPLTYSGSEQTQTVTSVVIDGLTVTYTIGGNTAINVGETDYTLTITGTGNFTGTETATWNIAQQTGKTAATATTVQYFDTAEKTVDIAPLIANLTLANDNPAYAIFTKGSEIDTARMDGGSLKFQLIPDLPGTSEQTNSIVIEVTGLTNYDKVTVTVTVTITSYTPVVVDMSGITLNSKDYDGEELTYSGEAVGSKDEPITFIYEWYKKDSNGNYVPMTGTPKDAGDYQLKATVNTDGYSGSAVKDVTILKAAVTVRPESFEITVGDRAPTLTLMYAGLIGNETITPDVEPIFAITDARGNVVALENAVRSAGTYTITWSNAVATSFSDSDNYTVTKIETATLKVNSRPVVIPTYYILNFEENGGTTVKNITASYGVTIDLSKYTTTRIGYIFDGWYSDARLTNEITSVRLTKNTTVYAGWTEIKETPGPIINPFKDIYTSDWYYDDVMFVYENGLMNGTAKNMFSPALYTTRGMIVTILYRLEGEPNTYGLDNPFTDLTQDWYVDAVKWAAANGIVEGYGNGLYGPEDPITREQMVTILWRYAKYKGVDVSVGEDTNILSYNDAFEVSEYAIPAMQWACGEGIIHGDQGNLTPNVSAPRCQVAAILHRFCELIEE